MMSLSLAMTDEKSKQQDPQQGVSIRKKASEDRGASPEVASAGEDRAYSAKADERVGRARVAYAQGFEPGVGAAVSQPTASAAKLSAEELTAQAVPEAGKATTDDFAAMFEQQAAPARQRYEVGDRVEGRVAHIDTGHVFVDLGQRVEGRVARGQLTDKNGELEVALGQSYEFYVLDIKRDGIILGKHLDDRDAGIYALEQAAAGEVPVQGKVTARNKGGFDVEIMNARCFCPVSQIDLQNQEDLDVYLGQTYSFLVMEVREGGRNVVVSRRALLQREADVARKKALETLQPGSILQGTVRSLAEYGAFVDLGGVDGLVHVSELSWGATEKPSDVVREGQEVTVKILSMSGQGRQLRIALSMKQVEADPWETINERFAVGQELRGKVVRTAPYGAFVEIAPGIDGLVHVSELSWSRVTRPTDVVTVGEEVRVRVQVIDMTKRRVSLSMREAKADPWDQVEETYPIGAQVSGQVEKVEDFGAFIAIASGITALLPRSEMNLSKQETPQGRFRAGHEVQARVLTIDRERRRIALTLREEGAQDHEAPARQERKGGKPRQDPRQEQRQEQPAKAGKESFGTFADLLRGPSKK